MDPMGEMLEPDEEPEVKRSPRKQAAVYGVVAAIAIFFVGWSTGMGGSWLPNLLFSLLMGVFAAFCFLVVQRFAKKGSS